MVLLYEKMIRAITADSRGGRADLFLGGWDEVTLSCEVLTAFGKLCFVRVAGLAFALRLSGCLNWIPIVRKWIRI